MSEEDAPGFGMISVSSIEVRQNADKLPRNGQLDMKGHTEVIFRAGQSVNTASYCTSNHL